MSGDTLYGSLTSQTLGDIDGFLETGEGFSSIISSGGSTIPSIGFGSYLGDPNSLPAVLNAMTWSNLSVTLTNGQVKLYSGNVYQIASQVASDNGLSIPNQSQITSTFAPLGKLTISSTVTPAIVEGYFTVLLDSWLTTGTASGPQTTNIPFVLSPAEAELALNTLVNGVTNLPESLAGSLTIQGKSPTTAGDTSGGILAGYNIGVGLANLINASNVDWLPQQTLSANQEIPGLDPASAAWQAIINAAYLGIQNGANTRIGQAVAAGDFSYVWYLLRDVAGGVQSSAIRKAQPGIVLRDYAESEMFGLNGQGQQSDIASLQSALEDYETLTKFHSAMVAYDSINARNPATSINAANQVYAASKLGAQPRFAGPLATTPPVNPVLALNQEFAPAEAAIAAYLDANTPFAISPSTFSPTSIYVSADVTQFEAGVASNPLSVEAAPDIVPVPGSAGNLLIGPISVLQVPSGAGLQAVLTSSQNGNDMLVAAAGNELLNAVGGTDTLIGGGGVQVISPVGGGYSIAGNDTLRGGTGFDVFDFSLVTGATLTETLLPGSLTPSGVVEVSSGDSGPTILGGSATAQLTIVPGQTDEWQDSLGTLYAYSGDAPELGTMTVSGGVLGANKILIDDFNIVAAESVTGFLGLHLASPSSLVFGANAGGLLPDPSFVEGAVDAYTLSVNVPSSSPQEFTVTLTGALPSDFEVSVDDTIQQINANGSFSVALAAGQTNVSFALIDVTADSGQSDIANGANLQLAASLPNAADTLGSAIVPSPINFAYLPVPWQTDAETQPTDTITGMPNGDGQGVTLYTGDGSNDYIATTGTNNAVFAQNSGNDFIVGNNSLNAIYAGNGNSIITGNGGTDIIFAGNGENEIYAGTRTSIANAIAAATTATRTGLQGDLISVMNGDNTIVGGDGNDLILAGTGANTVILGPGNDLFYGGIEVTGGLENWNVTNGVLNDVNFYDPGYINTFPQPYNGVAYTIIGNPNDTVATNANDTVFGGSGNDEINLGNGNNYVDMGTGNSSLYGGMGNDTIEVGSGNDYVHGGGGNTYIAGGTGTDLIFGGDGDNTIIAGAGAETIYSSNGPGGFVDFANDSLVMNYVVGGSGNDLIYGSAGQDTLIAGSGNTTIAGQSGNENIIGGSGNDYLYGGTGNSTIAAGGSGLDSLYAGGSSTSTSYLYGGDGTDFLLGGSGTNIINAGDGGTADAATSAFASQTDNTATTTINGGLGVDFLEAGTGSTVINGGDGGTSSAPTTLIGWTGNDTIYGGLGTDVVQGGTGTNVLYAGDGGTSATPTTVNAGYGMSTLYGGAGDSLLLDPVSGSDVLVSESGDDTLVGVGADTLVAGSGDDAMQSNGGTVTVQINAGFGNDTLYSNGGNWNISFGAGMAPTDFTGSIGFDSLGNAYTVLTGDGGSLTIEAGYGAALNNISFADIGTVTQQTLLNDAFGGPYAVTTSSGTYELYLADDQLINGSTGESIVAIGSGDTITAEPGQVIYSSGANTTITSPLDGAAIEARRIGISNTRPIPGCPQPVARNQPFV